MTEVEITSWSKGFQTVSCIRLLQSMAGLGLADAKRVTENVLGGKKQTVSIRSEADVSLFMSALAKLGAVASIKAAL